MIGRPKEMEDRKTIQINIEKSDYDQLRHQAMSQGTTLSALLRCVIENHLAPQDKSEPDSPYGGNKQ